MDIRVKFFGNPQIFISEKELFISKNKLRLLLLYLLYNENCNRDELAALFWGDQPEEKAKANLRNTLYEMKKILPEGILKIEGHDYVGISKKIQLIKDVNLLTENDKEKAILQLSDMIFMDKVTAGNNIPYNEWMQSVRSAYERILFSTIESQLNKAIELKNISLIFSLSNKLIELDQYCEKAYRELIKSAIANHSYSEGLKLYRKMTDLLKKDLGEEPEEETRALYRILKEKSKSQEKNEERYFERIDRILELKQEYDFFAADKPFCHLMVEGEKGSGKTHVIEGLLKNVKEVVLKAELFANDRWHPYKAIERLLENNPTAKKSTTKNSKNQVTENPVAHTETPIQERFRQWLYSGKNLKIILCLKNIQYIDMESLKLLAEYIFDKKSNNENIFFIGELSREIFDNEDREYYIENLTGIRWIEIPVLTEHQTSYYIQHISESAYDESFDKEIYRKSQGNIMMIDYLHGKGEEKVREAFLCVKQKASKSYELLKIIALFKQRSTFKAIEALAEDKGMILLRKLEGFLKSNILLHENDVFKIKYEIYKQWIYEDIEPSIRIYMHDMAAKFMESMKTFTYEDYEERAYQYQCIGNKKEQLSNQLTMLQIKLDYKDQLFPLFKAPAGVEKKHMILNFDAYEEMHQINQQLENIKNEIDYQYYFQMKMQLSFIMGRTMIAGGRSEEGLRCIEKCSQMAEKIGSLGYEIDCLFEKIHYSIHTDKDSMMNENIELLKNLLKDWDDIPKKADLMRLEGLYYIRQSDFEKAEDLLMESIHTYDLPKYENLNVVPVAAAYNYLGNLYTARHEYEKAEKYYQKAIHRNLSYDIVKSLEIFYADYGFMKFRWNCMDQSEQILTKALEYYNLLGTHWKRSLVESLLGLIKVSRKDIQSALIHLRSAEIFYRKDKKELELEYLTKLKEKVEQYK